MRRGRPWGVASRLLAAAMLLVLISLPLAGLLLVNTFKQAVTTSFDQRLESLLNVVLAGIEYDPQSNRLIIRKVLGDARFERVFSGWYWQISDGAEYTLTSRSLWDQRLPISRAGGVDIRDIPGPRQQRLRRIERAVQLPRLATPVHLTVAIDRAELDGELQHFQRLLWLSLLFLGVFLVLAQTLQVRWGLSPLRRIVANLRDVEQGERSRLDADLPAELRQLAEAINTVLVRDQKLIERGRHAAGNLAHALKTPVSVLFTLTERLPPEQREKMQQELNRLNEAVRHHLARASAAGAGSLAGDVAVATVLAPVLSGIRRMAQRRDLHFASHCPETLRLRIDPQDLQEMLGNLLENACQWASRSIRLHCAYREDYLQFQVSDDGPGMTEDDCIAALQRGLRLDEQHSGSGLGLAIVHDLVKLYGGELLLSKSEEGGLSATLKFPLRQT